MRLYPAIRAQMGDWKYYIVRMKMREVANEVKLAHDIYEDKTLSEAVQRALGEKRVRTEITGYLSRRPDRFFSSIVVAALEGEPSWYPVQMDEGVVPEIFSKSRTLNDSFGILSFGDDPKYYALDGQHRVAAIKMLVNREANIPVPRGFDNELLSVLVVLREEHAVDDNEWMTRYRRLFSSLNRYAKATDTDTNIIMDEDDLVAILTRRLISEYDFFRAPGRERESFRVLTKGNNLRERVSHFTTLQTLYKWNEILLTTNARVNLGWSSEMVKLNKQIRPDEDDLDEYYEELTKYWDAILAAMPELRQAPEKMRVHAEGDGEQLADHVVFWPIGQELFARFVRTILNAEFNEEGRSSVEAMTDAIRRRTRLSWDLHELPWRYLLLTPRRDSWQMRSEQRKDAVEVVYRILCWVSGIDEHSEAEVETLRDDWREYLYPPPTDDEQEVAMWKTITELRAAFITEAE